MAGVCSGITRSFLSTNDFQFIRSFEIIIMIVLGGMGSLTGAVSRRDRDHDYAGAAATAARGFLALPVGCLFSAA